MSLAPGTRFGPYEIAGSLGAGGMGEVYRATDTRLDRAVAVKVLQGSAAQDPEFRARFQREARAVAGLNHPNICVLHDVGQHGALDYFVMELLEGQTLAERLGRGPLPPDQIVRYGIQIGEALAAAHRRGVVHRDLKPANIMITPSSGLKVLDFGLAKSLTSAGEVAPQLTQTVPVTARGSVLGTPGYIAPEQLLGRDADTRSDIFALGAVLFEMATGQRAFDGSTPAAIVASILERDPTPQLDGARVPPLLKRIIEKCLVKDPDERWQSAADVVTALRWVTDERTAAGAGARGKSLWPWVVTGGALLAAVAAIAVLLANRRAGESEPVMRTSIVPPAGVKFVPRDITGTPYFALSPDAGAIVYVASGRSDPAKLWLRPLNSSEARALPGTEEARSPFWSPDSAHVAFFAGGRLKTVAIADGSVRDLAAINATSGSWSPSGVLLVADAEGLARIAVNTGSIERVANAGSGGSAERYRAPQFLEDGRSFLFLKAGQGTGGTYLVTPDQPTPQLVLEGLAPTSYYGGYLLFERNGTLTAQRLDARTGGLLDEAVSLGDKVQAHVGQAHFPVSVARTGTLAYWNGLGTLTRLEWYDRAGRLLRQSGDQDHYFGPSLTPDGKRLLVTRRLATEHQDLWVVDVPTDTWTRLTFSPTTTRFGIFTRKGTEVIYASALGGGLMQRPSTNAGEPTPVFETARPAYTFPLDWSRDDRWFVYNPSFNQWDVWAMDARDRTTRRVLGGPFNETQAQLSPDSRWLAYASDESGTWEVYVTSFPASVGKWQVSARGGSQPRWSNDGKELFFLALDNALMSVSVRAGAASVEMTPARRLFQTKAMENVAPFRIGYAVSPKGEFLIGSVVREAVEPITLVHNWTAALPPR